MGCHLIFTEVATCRKEVQGWPWKETFCDLTSFSPQQPVECPCSNTQYGSVPIIMIKWWTIKLQLCQLAISLPCRLFLFEVDLLESPPRISVDKFFAIRGSFSAKMQGRAAYCGHADCILLLLRAFWLVTLQFGGKGHSNLTAQLWSYSSEVHRTAFQVIQCHLFTIVMWYCIPEAHFNCIAKLEMSLDLPSFSELLSHCCS